MWELSPANIAFITVGEKPHERIFHSVKVVYPRQPRRAYAAVLDEIAQRLGVPVGEAASFSQRAVRSRQDAIKIIDLARGNWIQECLNEILYGEGPAYAELPPQDQERLRLAAATWLETDDARASGALLGLWAKLPEFVTPALDVIESGGRQAKDVARTLQRASDILTSEHIERIRDILLTNRPSRGTTQSLQRSLSDVMETNSQAAIAAQIALLRAPGPWLWWPAARNHWRFQQSREFAANESDLRERIVLVNGNPSWPEHEQAVVRLPDLLSLDLLRVSPELFAEILREMRRYCDPDLATPAVVKLLEQLAEDPLAVASEGYASPAKSAVVRCVQLLNDWHGMNIGSIGQDEYVSEEPPLEWGATISEVMHWWETQQQASGPGPVQ